MYWVPVLKSLYEVKISITQGPAIWVPGLLGQSHILSDKLPYDPYLAPDIEILRKPA